MGKTIKEWVKDQFTKERMVRYLDGSNPGLRYGYQSFVQLICDKELPWLWSSVHVTTPEGKRNHYRLKVQFCSSQKSFAAAELTMWYRWDDKRTLVVHFEERENGPKKLNKAIRSLRNELEI